MKSLSQSLHNHNPPLDHRPVSIATIASNFHLSRPFKLLTLIQKLEAPPPPPPPQRDPQITVSKQGSSFKVQGNDFQKNTIVRIRVLDPNTLFNYFGPIAFNWPRPTSDGNGKIDITFALPNGCQGTNISISATDNRVAPGGLPVFSNIVQLPCA